MRLRILGIGMGLHHLTREVAEALSRSDYVVATRKGPDDQLLAVRQTVCDAYGVELVEVEDPERDRVSTGSTTADADYGRAVGDWHAARLDAFEAVLRERGGDAAFLVWGDPALYDSMIRIVGGLAERLGAEWDVLPGISAPQLLAARHRIVLHEVGQPVHVTTARRLRDDIAAGQRNLVVFLTGSLDLDDLGDWSIWWGANLGTAAEELVAGRVRDTLPTLLAARERAKAAAGWVMDVYLLRAP